MTLEILGGMCRIKTLRTALFCFLRYCSPTSPQTSSIPASSSSILYKYIHNQQGEPKLVEYPHVVTRSRILHKFTCVGRARGPTCRKCWALLRWDNIYIYKTMIDYKIVLGMLLLTLCMISHGAGMRVHILNSVSWHVHYSDIFISASSASNATKRSKRYVYRIVYEHRRSQHTTWAIA